MLGANGIDKVIKDVHNKAVSVTYTVLILHETAHTIVSLRRL